MASKRKCKYCSEYVKKEEGYISANNMFFCNHDHAVKWLLESQEAKSKAERLKREREKVERKEVKAIKDKLKTKSEHANESQIAFNAFIRERDRGKPCISCGRFHQGQNHAGHYLSRGAHPEMRFDEKNCYLQCAPCNNHLSGNIVEYRKNLLAQYGQGLLDYLEGYHPPKHYTIEDLKEIKKVYRAKFRELKKGVA